MKAKTGIGFRRDLADEILDGTIKPDFIELAPENWIDMGGYWKRKLDEVAKKYPVTCHGLSLSIGSPEDLDWTFLKQIRDFLSEYNVEIYSEHLSYTKSSNAHLYDLLPIPFRNDAVDHVSDRIKQVQDFLGRKIAIENVSYYTPVAAEMTEIEFINQIAEKADCNLLMDVNNIYVNAFNHAYDAKDFIDNYPLHRVAYIHMAGHLQIEPDLIIDTHGEDIIDPVYELFDYTTKKMNPVPVLLERDFNFEHIPQLNKELKNLSSIAQKNWEVDHAKVTS